MTTQPVTPSPHAARLPKTPKRIRGARIWDWVAHRYAAKPVADQSAYEHKLAVTREYLFAQAEVLELGCGTGSTAIAHAPFVQRIEACDFSSTMIDIARGKAADAGVANIEFQCRDAADVPGSESSYDVVLALNLLHLLEDWQHVIERVYRRLRPGGVLISTTPCLNDAPAILRRVAPIGARLGVLPSLSFFSQDALAQAQTDAGFDLEYAWQANPKNGLFLVARKSC